MPNPFDELDTQDTAEATRNPFDALDNDQGAGAVNPFDALDNDQGAGAENPFDALDDGRASEPDPAEDWKRQAVPAMDVGGGKPADTGLRAPEVTAPQKTNVVPEMAREAESRQVDGPAISNIHVDKTARGTDQYGSEIGMPRPETQFQKGMRQVQAEQEKVAESNAGMARERSRDLLSRAAAKFYETTFQPIWAFEDAIKARSLMRDLRDNAPYMDDERIGEYAKRIGELLGTANPLTDEAKSVVEGLADFAGMAAAFSKGLPTGEAAGAGGRALDRAFVAAGGAARGRAIDRIVQAGAHGAGAALGMEAVKPPPMGLDDTVGDLAQRKLEQTAESVKGFVPFAMGMKAFGEGLPAVFYARYRWTPQQFKERFPGIMEKVQQGTATEGEKSIARDVVEYWMSRSRIGRLADGSVVVETGPAAALRRTVKGEIGMTVDANVRRDWVRNFPWLENLFPEYSRVGIQPAGLLGGAKPGLPGGGEIAPRAGAAAGAAAGTGPRGMLTGEVAPVVEGKPPVVEPVVEKKPKAVAPGELGIVDVPVRQVEDGAVALRPGLMQFKEMLNQETGESASHKETIAGKWDDVKAGNLLLWEPKDPKAYGLTGAEKYIVADGHGRVNYARKAGGIRGFNAQIVREEDGYKAQDAMILAAEKNITDGKGTVYDHAKFTRNVAATLGEAEAVARAQEAGIGRRPGVSIGLLASDATYEAFINERISAEQAAAIAQAAPRDEALQRAGIAQAAKGRKPAVIANYLKAIQARMGAKPSAKQLDLFGADDSAMLEMEAQADRATAIQKELQEQVTAVQSAARRPETAKKLGVDVKDPEGIQKRVAELKVELARWENWPMHPDLVARVTGVAPEAAEAEAKATPATGAAADTGPKPEGKPKGKLDNPQAYRDDGNAALGELDGLLGSGLVREAPPTYGGDLAAGARGESTLRRALRLTAESRGQAQATDRVDVLASRALQSKARALLDAVDAGRIDEAEAGRRWAQAQKEIAKGVRKWENRPVVQPTETDMFAPSGPAPGMLLEGKGEYGVAPWRTAWMKPDASLMYLKEDQEHREIAQQQGTTIDGLHERGWHRIVIDHIGKAIYVNGTRFDDAQMMSLRDEGRRRGYRVEVETPRATLQTIFDPSQEGGTVREDAAPYSEDPAAKIVDAGARAVLGATDGRAPTLDETKAALVKYGEKIGPYLDRIHAEAVSRAERDAGAAWNRNIGGGFSLEKTAGKYVLNTPSGRRMDLDLEDPDDKMLVDRLEAEGENEVREGGEGYEVNNAQIEGFLDKQEIPEGQREAARQELTLWAGISRAGVQADLPGMQGGAGQPGGILPGDGGSQAGPRYRGGVSRREAKLAQQGQAQAAAREAWLNPTPENWARAWELNGKSVSTVLPALMAQKIPAVDVRGMMADGPSQAAGVLWMMKTPLVESFKVLYLDSNGAILEARVVSTGVLDASLAHPREVFRNAPEGTAGVVLGHNHPSGDVTLSKEDRRITRQLVDAGRILGIPVVDHVITNGKYRSMAEHSDVVFDKANKRVRGLVPAKQRREAPTLPDDLSNEYRRESWELIKRESRTGLQGEGGPTKAADWFKMVGQEMKGEYRHIMVLSTRNDIASAIRVPVKAGAQEVFRAIAEQAGEAGGGAFIIEIADITEDIRLMRQLSEAGKVYGIALLDAIQWTSNADAPFVSMREQGILEDPYKDQGQANEGRAEYMVAEEKAEYGGDLVSLARKIAGRGPAADAALFEKWYMGMAPLGDPKARVNDPKWSVFPAELPEAVQFAKDMLGGKYPRTAEKLRAMRGAAAGYARMMQGNETGLEIALRRDLFRLIPTEVMQGMEALADQYAAQNPPTNPQDTPAIVRARYLQHLIDQAVTSTMLERPAAASHVLWHEIGHLADHVPEGMIHQRGNILGRIASLKQFTKDMLPIEHKDLSKLLTPDERYEIRKKAAKDVGPAPNKKDEAALQEWREAVKARYQEMLDEEARKRGLARKQWIIDELEALSMWWRGDQEMSDYTQKPEELYANAFSAILNNPDAVHARAPTYYQAFFRWLEDKPKVKRLYDEIQDRIVTGAVQDQRAADQLQSMIEADRKSQVFADALNTLTGQEWRDVIEMSADRRFGPIYRRGRQVGGAVGMRSKKAIADWLYHQASNKLYLERMVNEVGRSLREAGVPRAEFNLYLANLHILHNRFDIASPIIGDAPAAQQALEAQKARLGPAKWAAMEAADAARWKIRNEEVLDLAPLRAMLSEEMVGILKARRHYSAVSAVDTSKDAVEILFNSRYGGQIGGMIYRQVGYLGDAKSPMLATSQKDVSLISAAYRNEATAATVAVLKELGEGRASKWAWDKNLNRQAPVMVDNDRIKTLVWLERGELQAWDAPATIHDMIQRSTPQDTKAGMMIIGRMTRELKSLWTDRNFGFWPFNYIRDTKGFAINMPGVYSRVFGKHAYIRYRGRAVEAARSILEGNPNELAKQAMRRNMIIVTREYVAGEGDQEAFDRFLKGYGIDPTWFGYSDSVAGRRGLFRRYMDVGRRLEYEVKIAGMLHVDTEARLKALPEAEKQRIVQEYAGSPNFLDRGTANWLLDAVLPFYNPAKQGYRRSINAWREHPGEKALKMAKYAVLPKLVRLALLGGAGALLLGKKKQEELKAADLSIPTWDKANYDTIPLGFADRARGKALYWRGVEEEEERLIGGILAMGIAKAQGEDVRWQDIFNFAGGQLPGLNPIGVALWKNAQFLGGTNPEDRGGKIVDQTRFDAGLGKLEMAKWTANQLGAGLVVRFQRDNFYDPEPTMVEKVLNWPIISNLAGRFLKVSNRGLDQKAEREIRAPARERSAKMRLGIQEIMDSGLNQDNQAALMEPGAQEYLKKAAKEKSIQAAGVDPYTREMMRVMGSPMKRAVMQRPNPFDKLDSQ